MPYLRLRLPLLMGYRRQETMWEQYAPYVKAILWLYSVPVLIIVVMLICDTAEGLARLRILGIGVGIYLALIVPAYFYYRDRAV